MDYIYKATKKLLKSDYLTKIFPIGDAKDGIGTYAKGVKFEKDSKIVNSLFDYLDNKKWQMNAGVYDDEERQKLKEQGLEFEEIWVDTDDGKEQILEGFKVKRTDELYEEFTNGVLMFDAGGEYKNMLYVGTMDETYPFVYFHCDVVDAHCPEIIKALLDEGFIRRVSFKKKKTEQSEEQIEAEA